MYKLIRPLLFKIDSETIHEHTLGLVSFINNAHLTPPIKLFYGFEDDSLKTNFLGINLNNPVGLAAGFDKSLVAPEFWSNLGFGFVEAGNITAHKSDGNPKPRLFRLIKDQGLINRIGLANIGADAMSYKLQANSYQLPFGINIAKTHNPNILGDKAVEDFLYTFKKLYGFGNYITLNISCPNTVEGKTFEEPEALKILLSEIVKAKATFEKQNPILVKISPDVNFGELDKILEVCESFKMDGYVLTNTAKFRDGLTTSSQIIEAIGKGGLSGKPLRKKATELVRHAYKNLKRPCLVGLGGIDSAEAAYERIKAGASVLQIYTGLIYEGPSVVKNIKKGLVELLKRDGFKNLSEAVGVEAK